MITVGIVEDDFEIRDAVQQFLKEQADFSFFGGFDSVENLLSVLKNEKPPEVIIMDLELKGMSGINGIKILKDLYPGIDIIVFTVYKDTYKIFNALCSGATGYLLKSSPLSEISEGIKLLATGGSPMSPQIARQVIGLLGKDLKKSEASKLSEREKEIVVGLVDGLSYKMIADRMCISIETVRFHIKNIYKKLQVHCRSDVIRRSLQGEI